MWRNVADASSSWSCNPALAITPSVSHSLRYSWIRKINDTLSPRGSPHHVVILSTPKDLRSHLWPGFTTGQSQSHEGRTSVFLPSSSSPPSRYSEIPQYFPNSRFQFCRLLVPFHFFWVSPQFSTTVKPLFPWDDINILSRRHGQAKPCRAVPGGSRSRPPVFCTLWVAEHVINFLLLITTFS